MIFKTIFKTIGGLLDFLIILVISGAVAFVMVKMLMGI